MILFSFLQEQGGTVRLSKAIPPRLKIDEELELTRQAKGRCPWKAAAKAIWEVSERKGNLPRLKLWRSNFPAYLYQAVSNATTCFWDELVYK
jgi:hypothetical protein